MALVSRPSAGALIGVIPPLELERKCLFLLADQKWKNLERRESCKDNKMKEIDLVFVPSR